MRIERKTKIVCTLGPATESQEKINELVMAGMDVARLNFSHSDMTSHQKTVELLHIAVKKTGRHVAIMQDLSGPKIRLGEFSKPVSVKKGDKYILTGEEVVGDEKRAHVSYPYFAEDVKKGDSVLIQDGTKKMRVTEIHGKDVICKVEVGGELLPRRGVNLPGTDLRVGALTEKDREDLKFSAKNNTDFVALSFVRKPEDVEKLRNEMKKLKIKAGIISKIETPQGVENIDRIIELSDGIMVARGDMAIEVSAEKVPMIQKMIVGKCNAVKKPVIVATQMLESMVDSSVPTRAEVNDVANAILDGADAVMLSEETAVGKYPIEAAKEMARIIIETEKDFPLRETRWK